MTREETITKTLATFASELALLSTDLRDFVVETFAQCCPGHFWTIPASTSGKYHPQIVLGDGGLIRHVKLAVWWGLQLWQACPDVEDRQGEIVAALLLHDLWKNGQTTLRPFHMNNRSGQMWPKGPANITATHGGLLAEVLLTKAPVKLFGIIWAIGGHMGRWTDEQYKRFTPENNQDALIQIVHNADYCASRRLIEDQR